MLQSIIFDKSEWTKTQATYWVKTHHYNWDFKGTGEPDETIHTYRFRQAKPDKDLKYVTQTIYSDHKVRKAIKLVVSV